MLPTLKKINEGGVNRVNKKCNGLKQNRFQ